MVDLIDRQAVISDFEWCKSQAIDKNRWQEAIDRIKALPSAEEESFEWCHDCKEYDKSAHCCHRWTKVIRNTVEEIKNEQRWVPVSERLPDRCVNVLVQLDGDWIEISALIGDVWQNQWGLYCPTNDVVAWMPLPEPYAERRQDETD